MITIYLCDSAALTTADTEALLARLPQPWRDTVPPTAPPVLRLQRALARTVLRAAVGEGVTLRVDAQGAPHLSDGRAVSISHDGCLCAVAVGTDARPLGVDVQAHTLSPDRAASIEARFLAKWQPSAPIPPQELRLVFVHILPKNDYICVQTENITAPPAMRSAAQTTPSSTETVDIYTKWTCLEALLKSSARGFAALPTLPRLCATCATATEQLQDSRGARYTLSVAVEA